MRFLVLQCVFFTFVNAGLTVSEEPGQMFRSELSRNWLSSERAKFLNQAINVGDTSLALSLLTEAFADKGVDIVNEDFGSCIQEMKDIPGEVAYGAVILSILENKCNFGYAVINAINTKPPHKKERMSKEWIAAVISNYEHEPGNPLIVLCLVDALLRNGGAEQTSNLLEWLIQHLQQKERHHTLLSFAYFLGAQSQIAVYHQLKEQHNKTHSKNDHPTIVKKRGAQTHKALSELLKKINSYYYYALGEVPEVRLGWEPSKITLADVHVNYAYFSLSKLKFGGPSTSVDHAELALKEDSTNLYALLILKNFDNDNSLLKQSLQALEGTFTTEVGMRFDPFKFDVGLYINVHHEIETKHGGITSLFVEGLNFKEISAMDYIVTTLAYPGTASVFPKAVVGQ